MKSREAQMRYRYLQRYLIVAEWYALSASMLCFPSSIFSSQHLGNELTVFPQPSLSLIPFYYGIK